MAADGGATDPRSRLIPWADLAYDIGNPRRSSPDEELDLSDLVGPVRVHGILAPLLVERNGSTASWLIVDGERRHRTAGQVDRKEPVPCIVLDDLDTEARLELQLASYARAPMGPLQEARAYRRLLDAFQPGFPVQVGDIAERLGKRPADIRRRLLLLDLVPGAQELLSAGGINLDISQRIAGLSPQGQEAVVARAKGYLTAMPDRAPLRHADLAGIIEDQRRRLDTVPWKLDDATLLPAAGACSSCPKRTSAQLALLGETVEGDECTDAACYGKKGDAWRVLRNDAEAARTVGPTKAAAGKEAREGAFKPPKTKAPSPAGTVTPAGDDGGERARAAKQEADDRAVQLVRGARLLARADHPLLTSAWIRRLVSPDALELAAEVTGADALLLEDESGAPAPILSGDLLALLAAELLIRGGELGALVERAVKLPEKKPAERVTGKSRAKPDPQSIPCPVAGCPAKAGESCTNYRGKNCAPHGERVKAMAKQAKASPSAEPAAGKAEAQILVCDVCGEQVAESVMGGLRTVAHHKGTRKAWCKGTTGCRPTAENPGRAAAVADACPLTRADVLRLGASIGMRADPHEGAHSTGNVWSCVEALRAHPPVAGGALASREMLYKLRPSAGSETFDLAIAWLIERGEAKTVSGRRGSPKEVLSLVNEAIARDVKPDNIAPRSCKVCGCTTANACQDDSEHNPRPIGECEIGEDGVCSVCARCCAKALEICAAKQSPTALEKALRSAKGKTKGGGPIETWDPTRVKGALAHLEATGALGRTTDGKLLASQPPT